MYRGLACVAPTRDGGKACTDSSQCEGRCLDVGNAPRQDGVVVGACQVDDNPCGTFPLIENGKHGGVLNAD